MLLNGYLQSRVYQRMLRRAFRETFIGAYAVEYVRQVSTGECDKEGHWNIEAAVRRGCKAQSYNLSHDGCIYPLPWANEINE